MFVGAIGARLWLARASQREREERLRSLAATSEQIERRLDDDLRRRAEAEARDAAKKAEAEARDAEERAAEAARQRGAPPGR